MVLVTESYLHFARLGNRIVAFPAWSPLLDFVYNSELSIWELAQ